MPESTVEARYKLVNRKTDKPSAVGDILLGAKRR